MTDAEQQGFEGVIIPVVTPFTAEEKVDEQGLRQQVRRCVKAGVSAVFAGGSAGSGPLLPDHQWEQAARIVAEETNGKCHFLLGIIATSTPRALQQISFSRQLGCKSIVVTPSFYITLQRDNEFLAHFQACREATDQDLIIYNIPGCTGSNIPVPVMQKMCEAGWASGIKESSGNADYFRNMLEIGSAAGTRVFQGNEIDIVWSLQAGASGIVPVCGNYDPAMFVEIFNSISRGGAAGDAQEQINALRDVLLVGDHNWIAGITWGLKSLGIGNGIPLSPLQPVDEERRILIDNLKSTV